MRGLWIIFHLVFIRAQMCVIIQEGKKIFLKDLEDNTGYKLLTGKV